MERFDRVISWWKLQRSVELIDEDAACKFSRFPLTAKLIDGKDFIINLTKQHIAYDPIVPFHPPQRDRRNLEQFLRLYRGGYVTQAEPYLPGSTPELVVEGKVVQKCRPGSPLIDFILAHLHCTKDGWRHPSLGFFQSLNQRVGLGYDLIEGETKVDVREVTLTEQDPRVIQEFCEWVNKRINDEPSPFKALSMDAEYITIPAGELARMQQSVSSWPCSFTTERMRLGHPGSRDALLVRLMFGDGIKWCAQVRLNVQESGPKFTFLFDKLHPDLLELIQSLPTVYGVGIRKDMLDLEMILTKLHGSNYEVTTSVDLKSLALACGYRYRKTDLATLFLVSVGRLLCKTGSCADQTWGRPWNWLDRVFRIYSIGDVMSGYTIYNVFMTVLLLDQFCDPDVLCTALGARQADAAQYFGDLINHLLSNTDVSNGDRNYADRGALLDSILPCTERNFSTSKKVSTLNIQYLKEMFHLSQPHFLYGGPRFLHQARWRYPQIEKVWAKIGFFPTKVFRVNKDIRPDILTFNRDEPILAYPAAPPGSMGSLVCHPELRLFILELKKDGDWIISREDICIMATNGLVPAILEFFRLNIDAVPEYFRHLESLSEEKLQWWKSKTRLYEYIRLQYVNTQDVHPPIVTALHNLIEGRTQKAIEQQRRLSVDYPEEKELCSNRVKLLEGRKCGNDWNQGPISGAEEAAYGRFAAQHTKSAKKRARNQQSAHKKLKLRMKWEARIKAKKEAYSAKRLAQLRLGFNTQSDPDPEWIQHEPVEDQEMVPPGRQVEERAEDLPDLREVLSQARQQRAEQESAQHCPQQPSQQQAQQPSQQPDHPSEQMIDVQPQDQDLFQQQFQQLQQQFQQLQSQMMQHLQQQSSQQPPEQLQLPPQQSLQPVLPHFTPQFPASYAATVTARVVQPQVPCRGMEILRVPIHGTAWEIIWMRDHSYLFFNRLDQTYHFGPPEYLAARQDVRLMQTSVDCARSFL